MTDTKKVIRMLNNTLRHCHNLYNHVTSEEQTWLAEINQGAKEALELLKVQEKQKFFVDESGKITPLPEIVRCKDCKRKDTLSCPKAPKRPDDWFCADGKRRETND